MKFTQLSFLELRLNLSKMKEEKGKKIKNLKKIENQPHLKGKKKPNMKARHSRTLKQMDHASICFSKEKKFIIGTLK